MKKTTFLILFVVSSLSEWVAVSLEWRGLEIVAKPLIVLSLIGWYFFAAARRSSFFLAALFFCWLGDVLLMFDQLSDFLIYGLLAFLMGHVCFIVSYQRHRFAAKVSGLMQTQKVRIAFPVLLAGTGLVVLLYPVLGDLRIPVMVYSAVLTAMVITSILRKGRTGNASFWLVFFGALLFMTSDSLLAINKFSAPFAYASIAIMSTYCTAQFLMVKGILSHTHRD